ncbi:hypothetical protein DPMN_173654 [Dreissena polymorpha]|uniref:Uncharacterized protein n=1 Tax=Dreissena polymorpha TaxID=45954 RepID=A0A9D4E4P1_DREPO|nr:hypothetical protein DPMN_173654 [Dreissena polymorpha]
MRFLIVFLCFYNNRKHNVSVVFNPFVHRGFMIPVIDVMGIITICQSTRCNRCKTPGVTQVTQDTLIRPKSNQVDPSQPKSTQVNPSRPKSTQVDPSRPKSTQVNPSRPKSTQVNPKGTVDTLQKLVAAVGYIGTTLKASRLSVTMASHQEQSDLDRIRAELEHVKLENARLELENEVSCDRPLETAAPDHSSMRRQVPTVVGCNVQTQTDEPRVNKCDVCDITFGNQAMIGETLQTRCNRCKTPGVTQVTQDTLSRPKSTQVDPSQPKSTQVNPSRPKSTQVDPSRPKSTQVDPSRPKSTQVDPSRPKSTQVIKAIQVAQGIRNRLV